MTRRRGRESKATRARYVHVVTVRHANGRYVISREFASRYAARVQRKRWLDKYDETYSVTHESHPRSNPPDPNQTV